MGHDAPRHRVVDCVEARDCSSTPVGATTVAWLLCAKTGSLVDTATRATKGQLHRGEVDVRMGIAARRNGS